MNIQQLYTSCLAQGAYFVESNGEAAVIDPIREIDTYLELAAQSGSTIKYIFETHFHADFVSGHIELAKATGAMIVYGPTAITRFESYIGADNEIFNIGELRIKLLHTPGHTLESCCYLLEDKEGKATAVFTGDTLFIGDVGRPDLAQQPKDGLSQYDLAGMLYDSLRQKIMPLADDVIVYPAHGAGSACGKNMSKEIYDSLGGQKKSNYALSISLTREQFIIELTTGLKPAPSYFPMNVRLNSEGYEHMNGVYEKSNKSLTASEVEEQMESENVIILDTRTAQEFALAHIPGAINIGLSGSFAPWVGTLLPYKNTSIIVVADKGKELDTITRLARIGYDIVIGYLEGGMQTWLDSAKTIAEIPCISADDFSQLDYTMLNLIDVRNDAEFKAAHIEGSIHLPLGDLEMIKDIPEGDKTYYVYCAGGYRSMIFISLLKARLNINLINVNGGFNALSAL